MHARATACPGEAKSEPKKPDKIWPLRSANEDEDVVVGHSADPHVVVEVVRGELRLRNVAPEGAADQQNPARHERQEEKKCGA